MNYNHLTIVGRLGADAELKRSQSGTKFANLRIGSNCSWCEKPKTLWMRATVFGKAAEFVPLIAPATGLRQKGHETAGVADCKERGSKTQQRNVVLFFPAVSCVRYDLDSLIVHHLPRGCSTPTQRSGSRGYSTGVSRGLA